MNDELKNNSAFNNHSLELAVGTNSAFSTQHSSFPSGFSYSANEFDTALSGGR